MPMSPTRLTTNAFLAAAAADGLCCQKPISRYDARPTPSQPRNSAEVVLGEHQREHRGDEQVEVGEEPAPARVVLHVADRVDVDQRADAGDQQQEQRRTAGRRAGPCRRRGGRPGSRCRGAGRPGGRRRRGRAGSTNMQQAEHEGPDRQRRCRAGGPTGRCDRPPSSRIAAPASGSAMTSHSSEKTPSAAGGVHHRDGGALAQRDGQGDRHQPLLLSTSAGSRRRPRPSDGSGRWS